MSKHSRVRRKGLLLALVLALPVLAGTAAVALLWGETIRDIISILVKMVVVA